MKSKEPVSAKKQTIIVKDLKTRKNPKGGGPTGSTIGQPIGGVSIGLGSKNNPSGKL